MARFTRIEVATEMKKTGMIPVFFIQILKFAKILQAPAIKVEHEFLNLLIEVIELTKYLES